MGAWSAPPKTAGPTTGAFSVTSGTGGEQAQGDIVIAAGGEPTCSAASGCRCFRRRRPATSSSHRDSSTREPLTTKVVAGRYSRELSKAAFRFWTSVLSPALGVGFREHGVVGVFQLRIQGDACLSRRQCHAGRVDRELQAWHGSGEIPGWYEPHAERWASRLSPGCSGCAHCELQTFAGVGSWSGRLRTCGRCAISSCTGA